LRADLDRLRRVGPGVGDVDVIGTVAVIMQLRGVHGRLDRAEIAGLFGTHRVDALRRLRDATDGERECGERRLLRNANRHGVLRHGAGEPARIGLRKSGGDHARQRLSTRILLGRFSGNGIASVFDLI